MLWLIYTCLLYLSVNALLKIFSLCSAPCEVSFSLCAIAQVTCTFLLLKPMMRHCLSTQIDAPIVM